MGDDCTHFWDTLREGMDDPRFLELCYLSREKCFVELVRRIAALNSSSRQTLLHFLEGASELPGALTTCRDGVRSVTIAARGRG